MSQLRRALFDVDCLHKPKMVALFHRYGHESITLFVEVICQISRATSGSIDLDTMEGIWGRFGIKHGPDIVAYCVASGILTREGNQFSNTRTIQDRESYENKKNKTTERQRRKRARDKRVTPVTVSVSVSDNDTDLDLDSGFKKIGKYLHLSEIDLENLKVSQGADVVERAAILADAQVDKAANTQDFEPLKRKAKHGGIGILNGWALSAARKQLTEEGARHAGVTPASHKKFKTKTEIFSDELKRIADL